MKLGIIGLPNVGKSTLFNAITKAGAESANYPFCTIEPNIGVVAVPDERVTRLSEIYQSDKTIYTSIEFCDIAGLVKGASQGEGLGNKFLGHIREVSAIVHVVRCFENGQIVHVNGHIDPIDDIETINTELMISDIEIVERVLAKLEKQAKADKSVGKTIEMLKRVKDSLSMGKPVRSLGLSEEDMEYVLSIGILSAKPVIYAANISEEDIKEPLANDYVKKVKEYALAEEAEFVAISAGIEAELSELSESERIEYMAELSVSESGLDQLIKASYSLLGLISFITAGKPETRAWTIRDGAKAPEAAGKIHTDFEKGFIRAEVIDYESLLGCEGNLGKAREKGLIRSEGKEYIVKDGDVIHFLFNV